MSIRKISSKRFNYIISCAGVVMSKQGDIPIIDFHCHILPGVDHGSNNIETSLDQLKLMKKSGVDVAVATSHFYPQDESINDFIKKRDEAAEKLFNVKDSDIKIALGAEVYAIAGLEKEVGLEKLTIKGTNVLLLEMPMTFWNTNIIETVFELDEKFDVVLAHIDRYPSKELDKILYTGIKAQINGGNSLKKFNRHRVDNWIYDGTVYAIGSDLHKPLKGSMKGFTKLQKSYKKQIGDIFARSAKLLSSAELY